MVGIDSESLVISPRLKITFVLDFRYSCSSHHPFAPGHRVLCPPRGTRHLSPAAGVGRCLRSIAGLCSSQYIYSPEFDYGEVDILFLHGTSPVAASVCVRGRLRKKDRKGRGSRALLLSPAYSDT